METNLPSETSGRPARRQYTAQQIQDYLQAQTQSGLTISAFCHQHGLHPSVFHGWKRRHRAPATAAFQEIVLPSSSAHWVAEITWPSGLVLRLGAQVDLARLVPELKPLLEV